MVPLCLVGYGCLNELVSSSITEGPFAPSVVAIFIWISNVDLTKPHGFPARFLSADDERIQHGEEGASSAEFKRSTISRTGP